MGSITVNQDKLSTDLNDLLAMLAKGLLLVTGLWRRSSAQHALLGRVGVGAVLAAALVLSGMGLAGARAPARVREVRLPVKGYTPALGRLRIAVFADLHAGDDLLEEFGRHHGGHGIEVPGRIQFDNIGPSQGAGKLLDDADHLPRGHPAGFVVGHAGRKSGIQHVQVQ